MDKQINSELYFHCYNKYNKTKPSYIEEFLNTIDYDNLLDTNRKCYSYMVKEKDIIEIIKIEDGKSETKTRQVVIDKSKIDNILFNLAKNEVLMALKEQCMVYIYNKELESEV